MFMFVVARRLRDGTHVHVVNKQGSSVVLKVGNTLLCLGGVDSVVLFWEYVLPQLFYLFTAVKCPIQPHAAGSSSVRSSSAVSKALVKCPTQQQEEKVQ